MTGEEWSFTVKLRTALSAIPLTSLLVQILKFWISHHLILSAALNRRDLAGVLEEKGWCQLYYLVRMALPYPFPSL